MDRVVKDGILGKVLGLTLHEPNGRGYKPKGTRDKFDFLCIEPTTRRPVVVELKKAHGEKRVVEQVLRYMGQLRHENEFDLDPRGIVITGESDPHTRNALRGQDLDRHIDWWIYGLDDAGDLKMERIEVERLARKGIADARSSK